VGPRVEPRRRFAVVADDYARFRPDYPAAVFDWLAAAAGVRADGPPDVVDVGCGTGIASRALAARGWHVVGIDPSEPMLAWARDAGGGPEYRRGEAGATGLADASVDLVTAAQALHWFDLDPALAEFRRILRPGGRVCAFWNLRDVTPFMSAYEALLRRHSPEYRALRTAGMTLADLKVRPGVRDPAEAAFPHFQDLDEEGFFGRVRSSSYVAHGIADREAFLADLGALYRAHAQGGRVRFAYRTVALAFGVR